MLWPKRTTELAPSSNYFTFCRTATERRRDGFPSFCAPRYCVALQTSSDPLLSSLVDLILLCSRSSRSFSSKIQPINFPPSRARSALKPSKQIRQNKPRRGIRFHPRVVFQRLKPRRGCLMNHKIFIVLVRLLQSLRGPDAGHG